MKDLDAKLRERYEQREYYGITRLEKAQIKRERKEKERWCSELEKISAIENDKERQEAAVALKLKSFMEEK